MDVTGKYLNLLAFKIKSMNVFVCIFQLLAASIYMEGILQFLNMRSGAFAMGIKGMDRVTFVPMGVKRKLFHEFTSMEGTVSAESRDKAMCHIIVLALLVNKFQVDFSEITSTLRVKADQ